MIYWNRTKLIRGARQNIMHVLVECESCKSQRWVQKGNAEVLPAGDLCRSCSNKASWDGYRTFDKSGKKCARCGVVKSLDDFSKDSRKRLNVRSYCKACAAELAAERRSANLEKSQEQKRMAQRKRRAIKQGCDEHFTARQWDALKKKYGGKCLRCGSKKDIQPDHVIPLSKGGSDGIENIQPLCGKCNREKQAAAIDYR